MLLLYLEQRAKALCGKWETVFFPGILQNPAPSLNKLITFLDFLLLLSISPSNILPQQKQKKKKKVSNRKTKAVWFMWAECNNKPHFLNCLPKECCDVKFQRKTLAQNQAVSYDNAPLNTKNNPPFIQRSIYRVPGENAIHTT